MIELGAILTPETSAKLDAAVGKPQPSKLNGELELLAYQELRVGLKGDQVAVLGPNQVAPIYDLSKWDLVHEFRYTLVSAVRYGDWLVGYGKHFSQAQLDHLLDHPDQDISTKLFEQSVRNTPLGNIGGVRHIRPERVPMVGLPIEGRAAFNGKPTLTISTLDPLEFRSATRGMREIRSSFPMPMWLVPADEGEPMFDIHTKRVRKFRPLEHLPFSIETAQKQGVLPTDADIIQAPISYLEKIDKMCKELGITTLYLGSAHNMGVYDKVVTQEAYYEETTFEVPLYVMPFHKDSPLQVFSRNSRNKALSILEGSWRGQPGERLRARKSHAAIDAANRPDTRQTMEDVLG